MKGDAIMIDVANSVDLKAASGERRIDKASIGVRSHPMSDEFVILDVDGKSYVVRGAELSVAINNATNTCR